MTLPARRLVDAFGRAWSERDPDAFAPLCTDDVHFEDPALPEPISGPEALAAHAGRVWAAFPDLRVEPTGPQMTARRHVAAPVKLVATHRGELGDLPPTGRFVVVQAVAVCELHPHRDLLWRVRAFFDVYGAAVQLGLLPARGSLGEKALLVLRGLGLRG